MIYARYSERPEEIEIEADEAGLVALSMLMSEGRGSIETAISSVSPAPFDGYIGRISVETDEGLVSISRLGKMLEIRGASELLSVLAQNLDVLIEGLKDASLDQLVRHHLHIEHFPGHPYLDSNAVPLVLLPTKGD